MNHKQLEKALAKPPRTDKQIVKVTKREDFLILDVWENKNRKFRYCIDCRTGEHEYLKDNKWRKGKLVTALGLDWYWTSRASNHVKISKEDNDQYLDMIKDCWNKNLLDRIESAEDRYDRKKRWEQQDRKQDRIDALMELVPETPDDLKEWIFEKAAGEDYLMKTRKEDRYTCTNCGKVFTRKELPEYRHDRFLNCPECGKYLQIKTRTESIRKKTQCYLIQPAGDEMAVLRIFYVFFDWECRKHTVTMDEAIRIVGYNRKKKRRSKKEYDLFYMGYDKWITANHGNYRAEKGFLYPDRFQDILRDTTYERAGRILEGMRDICMNYNRLLAGIQQSQRYAGMVEYLRKGRFWKLLQETAERTEYPRFRNVYYGELNLAGKTITEIFGIRDKQMINRIRDENGGQSMLRWMRYSERTGKKIPAETLRYLEANGIEPEEIHFSGACMTPQQIVNYIKRQQKEQYPGFTAKAVLEQYEDYLDMCAATERDLTDEMVFRPRELKRRHDEVVIDKQQLDIVREMSRNQEQKEQYAREMRKKYPTAEQTLHEIKDRYEYEDEEYRILVPQSLVEIVQEGRALHHCVGSSERYFDRIEDRETYICFLRRKSAPGIPFYTIEVEPGGTIRQHRSAYDEEPGIGEIREFLRKWQKVLRERLTRKDRELARTSKIKREQNMEELKAKRNTRVLQGLAEDFLEAEAAGWN